MKAINFISLTFICALTLLSCKKTYDVIGVAQKGPFISGTNITISELDKDLKPTGKNYYSTVNDNSGNFLIPDVKFKSQFVELMADGYYVHEYTGSKTQERLILKSISDMSDQSTININILTHISSERIKYLVQNENKSFKDAKLKAEEEVLNVFSLNSDDNSNFETLDLSESGEKNLILIAISSILQGARMTSDVTELLNNFLNDFKTDGIIDDKEIQTDMATSASLVNVGSIRKNLSELYNDTISSDFQKYIQTFINNTEYTSNFNIEYPKNTESGINLLSLFDNIEIDSDSMFCLAINNLSSFNGNLVISISQIDGSGDFNYAAKSLQGWILNPSDEINLECLSPSNCSNIPITISFQGHGEIEISMIIESNEFPSPWVFGIDKYIKW